MILESRGSRQEVQVPVSDRENRSGSSNTHQYRAQCRFHCRQLQWRKEGERWRESGGKDVEEKQEIQESRGSRREDQIPAREREYRSDRGSTHQYRADGRFHCRQLQWRKEGERRAETGGKSVEENRETHESRMERREEQNPQRDNSVQTDLAHSGLNTVQEVNRTVYGGCLLYTSPSPRDRTRSRMPSSA